MFTLKEYIEINLICALVFFFFLFFSFYDKYRLLYCVYLENPYQIIVICILLLIFIYLLKLVVIYLNLVCIGFLVVFVVIASLVNNKDK